MDWLAQQKLGANALPTPLGTQGKHDYRLGMVRVSGVSLVGAAAPALGSPQPLAAV